MNGYQEWYVTSPAGEAAIRKSISEDATFADGMRKRLEEMRAVPEGRCSITKTQIAFLSRILAS